jgi:outer membrane protein TolC
MFAQAADRPDLPPQLTLFQALEIALTNSTILRTAQARLEQSNGQYAQARAQLLPQLNVSARQSYLTENLIGLGIDLPSQPGLLGPFASMHARVFLTQSVLNIADVRAWQSSGSQQESSLLLVNDARELVTLDVVSAYLTALRAKASRDSLDAQTKLAEELNKLTKDRVNQGASAELDGVRSEQQVNSLEQQLQESQQNYVAAKLQLANILQARVAATFEVADDAAYGAGLGPIASDREQAMGAALVARADYRAAEGRVRAAELQVQSTKAYRLPTVRVTLEDAQSGSTPVNSVNTYLVAGTIDIPIFTGGRIRGEIEEAQGALHQARAALDENRSQVETDVLTAMSGVEWTLKEVATSAGNVTLSRQEVELTRQRFAQGISDNTELVNAQVRLSQADDASIRAQYALGLARANLARAVGVAEKTYRK